MHKREEGEYSTHYKDDFMDAQSGKQPIHIYYHYDWQDSEKISYMNICVYPLFTFPLFLGFELTYYKCNERRGKGTVGHNMILYTTWDGYYGGSGTMNYLYSYGSKINKYFDHKIMCDPG